MAAYTSTQTGNWSDTSTWGGSGPPGDGDTASIGAHTVTVDVNTTVGTSPNNNTTKVIDRTSGSSHLVVAAGVTLTVKGNIGGVNQSTMTMGAGSTLIFDASASGGTPVYTFINGGFEPFYANGTANSRVSIRSVNSSYTWAAYGGWSMNVYYCDFLRASSMIFTASVAIAGGTIVDHCTFDTCSEVRITQSDANMNFQVTDNVWQNSTDSTISCRFDVNTARVSGTRTISRNVTDKGLTLRVSSAIFDNNVLGGFLSDTTTTLYRKARNNYIDNTLNTNGGNGMYLRGSWDGLYCTSSLSAGNPHFIAPYCNNSADETYRRVIFESQSPDLVDTGDCFLPNSTFCSSGNKLIIRNCISIPNPVTGVQTGQIVTSYSPPASALTHKMEIYHTTTNQNKSSVGGVGLRAAVSFAEAAAGVADQIAALKSNLVWADATGNGYLAERASGTTDGHITAANANYNWLYNIDAGNNGRGYDDAANSPAQDLWAGGNADGGDAAAAGVDNNQGSGDPQFVDDTRCIATWCSARGYGSATFAAGVAALKADPMRVADLINYVFEGYKVQTAGARTAHDGASFGAANFHDTTRTLTTITSRNTSIEAAYAATFSAGT